MNAPPEMPASPAMPDQPPAQATSRYLERLLLAAALASAVVFIAVGIERPVWLDEANSVLIASRGFTAIPDSLSRDNNLPCYYFLLSLWMRIFGDSEIALRSLSALFYLGGCGVTFRLGRRLARNHRAACYSAFFYASSALAIRQAQNIRMYSLLGVLAGLSILAFVRVFRDGDSSWRARGLFFAVNTLGLLTHVWFVFVLAAQFVAVLIFERQRAWRFALAAAPCGASFVAVWGSRFIAQLQNGATDWMPRLSAALAVQAALEFYLPITTPALYMLAAASWIRATPETRRHVARGKGVALLLVISAVSLAVPLLVSTVRPIYWPGRYAIIVCVPLAALLGTLLTSTLRRPLLAGLCLAILLLQTGVHIQGRELAPDAQLPPGQSDRATAQFLLTHAAAGDVVVFTSLSRAAADYYLRRAHAASRFVEISFPAEVATHLGWIDGTVSPVRQVSLQDEAAAETLRIHRLADSGAHIWVYDGSTPKVSRILRDRLDQTLTLRREFSLEGPYHQRLLEYARPTPSPAFR